MEAILISRKGASAVTYVPDSALASIVTIRGWLIANLFGWSYEGCATENAIKYLPTVEWQ